MLNHKFPGLMSVVSLFQQSCLFPGSDLPTLGIPDRDKLSLTEQAGNYPPPCFTWEYSSLRVSNREMLLLHRKAVASPADNEPCSCGLLYTWTPATGTFINLAVSTAGD